MAQKTIVVNGSYVPVLRELKKIDDNFDELYAGNESAESDITDLQADVTSLQAGEGITLTEYADNAAAVTGGLEVGALYMTTGAVKVVTE